MFHLTIVTAEKTVYEGEIEMLVAPAVDGEIGIMTNHHPLVTKLGAGGLRVVKADKSEELLFVAGGYLEVNNNKATILANIAEDLEAIELEQARAARLRAADMLKSAKGEIEMEKLEEELRVQMIRERMAEVAKFRKQK